MSKKNEIEVVNMGSTNQNIDTSIDMKLSKQDLIDMVIEETRERLEAQVEAAQQASIAARNAVEAAIEAASEQFEDAIRSKYKAELTVIAKNGGEDGEPEITKEVYATELGLLSREQVQEHYNSRNRSETITRNGLQLHARFKVPSYLSVHNKVQKRNHFTREANLGVGSLSVQLDCSLTLTEMKKLYAPLVDLVKDFVAKENTHRELQVQLGSVDKMGKKAKTQLIKRLLESSEGGQAILSNMSGIKQNVAQLLLASTSK